MQGTQRSEKTERVWAGGVVTGPQWNCLGRLAKAPQKTMIVDSSLSKKYAMAEWEALELVNAGVARFEMGRKIIVVTKYGNELVSEYGFDGITYER